MQPTATTSLYEETDNVKLKLEFPRKSPYFVKAIWGQKGLFWSERAIIGNKEDGIR
jgi:hypothetical protein